METKQSIAARVEKNAMHLMIGILKGVIAVMDSGTLADLETESEGNDTVLLALIASITQVRLAGMAMDSPENEEYKALADKIFDLVFSTPSKISSMFYEGG